CPEYVVKTCENGEEEGGIGAFCSTTRTCVGSKQGQMQS
ncbi:unnamed protein product, partial [marine sediment metagenome]